MNSTTIDPERRVNQLLKRRAAIDQQIHEAHAAIASQLEGEPDAVISVPLGALADIQITRQNVLATVFLTTSKKSIHLPTEPSGVYLLPLDPGANDLRVLFSNTSPSWAFEVDLFVNHSRFPLKAARASSGMGGQLSVLWRISVP